MWDPISLEVEDSDRIGQDGVLESSLSRDGVALQGGPQPPGGATRLSRTPPRTQRTKATVQTHAANTGR